MYNFRTDMALERNEIYKEQNNIKSNVDGIEVEEEEKLGTKISRVSVTNEKGENALGKPIGIYTTIDIKGLKIAGDEEIEKSAEVLAKELKPIIEKHIGAKDDILVVGLGNLDVTPDSLGPKVIKSIDVTRHIIKYLPQYIDENARPVSAVSPGVLGTTGIETLEILEGVVQNIRPKMLIVIDALASRSIERISSTIQISDTGIVPGAGVGNTRKEISKRTLNIPVIAIRNSNCCRKCGFSK